MLRRWGLAEWFTSQRIGANVRRERHIGHWRLRRQVWVRQRRQSPLPTRCVEPRHEFFALVGRSRHSHDGDERAEAAYHPAVRYDQLAFLKIERYGLPA